MDVEAASFARIKRPRLSHLSPEDGLDCPHCRVQRGSRRALQITGTFSCPLYFKRARLSQLGAIDLPLRASTMPSRPRVARAQTITGSSPFIPEHRPCVCVLPFIFRARSQARRMVLAAPYPPSQLLRDRYDPREASKVVGAEASTN